MLAVSVLNLKAPSLQLRHCQGYPLLAPTLVALVALS
jgi:hypothetical protein